MNESEQSPAIKSRSAKGGHSNRALWLIGSAAVIALTAKLYCAWTTLGSTDVKLFYLFAGVIDKDGLAAAYRMGPIFNHPPLVGEWLRVLKMAARATGLKFEFLLRLPSILADLLSVALLVWAGRRHAGLRLPAWALTAFALSPVAFMISGYHGNTDPVMILFLLAAALLCCEDLPAVSGLFLALSLQIKIATLVVSPVLFFYWFARGKSLRFAITCAVVLLLGWIEPLWHYPALFLTNVLAYSSYWGSWGITFLLSAISPETFPARHYFQPSPWQHGTVVGLKVAVIFAVVTLAWWRRSLAGPRVFGTLACAWAAFLTLAPGGAAQYLVWPAVFVLLCSPVWYATLTVTSSVFLFVFYNTISHGMPWFYGQSELALVPLWAPYNVLPWLALGLGAVWFLWQEKRRPGIGPIAP